MFNSQNVLADMPVQATFKPWDSHALTTSKSSKAVKIEVFTDPFSAESWAMEPVLRKLELHYGDLIEFRYRMMGLVVSWEEYETSGKGTREDMADQWENLSGPDSMPLGSKALVDNMLHSSYPACIAFKAAELQSPKLAKVYLRRLREMLFVEGVNIARWKNLKRAAREVGLDVDVLLLQYNNGDGLKAFLNDQKLAREKFIDEAPTIKVAATAEGSTLPVIVSGMRNWDEMKGYISQVLDQNDLELENPSNALECFSKFRSLSTVELQTLMGREDDGLEGELVELEEKGKLISFGCESGRIWHFIQQ